MQHNDAPCPARRVPEQHAKQSWTHHCTAQDYKNGLWVCPFSEDLIPFKQEPTSCTAPYLVTALITCLKVSPYLPSVLLRHSNWQLRPPHNTNINLPIWGWRQDLLSPFLPFQIQARQTTSAVSSLLPSLSFSPSPFISSPPTGTDSCGANTPSSISLLPLSLSVSQWESRSPSFLALSTACLASKSSFCLFFTLCSTIYVNRPGSWLLPEKQEYILDRSGVHHRTHIHSHTQN